MTSKSVLKRIEAQRKDYPNWVCNSCGKKYGRRTPTLATYHQGQCGICGNETEVTEPRDFGHLQGWEKHGN